MQYLCNQTDQKVQKKLLFTSNQQYLQTTSTHFVKQQFEYNQQKQ